MATGSFASWIETGLRIWYKYPHVILPLLFHQFFIGQCDVEGCQMMDYRKFQSYYLQRGMKGAKNMRELERYVKKAKVI